MKDIKKIQNFFSGVIQESKKYGDDISPSEFANLKGTKIKYFGREYDVQDSNEDVIKISNKTSTRSINRNQFIKKGFISEGTIQDVEKSLQNAPIGATVYGGGYKWVKTMDNSFKTKNGTLAHTEKVASQVGGFDDFRIEENLSSGIDEAQSRVSMPRYVFDKINPNFLNVYIDYDLGPGGSSIALGKETMTGQIRRESAAEAMKLAYEIAKDLLVQYNVEDIDIQDLENGKVNIFAVSDDFIDMDQLKEGKPGLWDNIRAKRASGEKMSSKGSKAYKLAVKAGKRINKQDS